MENKLIPMTDFVLEQLNEANSRILPIRDVLNRLENYANFLKQPLSLGMFVPAGENGNFLIRPKCKSEIWADIHDFQNKLITFEKAEQRVLFKGFCIEVSENGFLNVIHEEWRMPVMYQGNSGKWMPVDSWENIDAMCANYPEVALTEKQAKKLGLCKQN